MKLISPIQAFIFASAGIHTGLIMMPGSTNITLPGSTGSVMSVKLEKKAQASIQPVQNKKITKPVQQASISRYKQKISDKVLTQPAATAIPSSSEAKAHVVSIIYKELNNHFNYPKIAQRRNWQGQVLLAFRLKNDGTIEDIKIDHSSGYNVLDQAAIISLKKIGQLPLVSSWLIDGMEIQIPIIYQLTQG